MSARDLPGERWRAVAGFEDAYEISDLGRVRSLARTVAVTTPHGRPYQRRIAERLLKPVASNGCLVVTLWAGGAPLQVRVAVLVAAAFLGAPPPGQDVLYRDADARNLALSNLRYATSDASWANRRARGALPAGERHGRARLDREAIEQLRGASGSRPLRVLAAQVGVSKSQVGRIVRGEQWRPPASRQEPLAPGVAALVRAIARDMAAEEDARSPRPRSRP